jgi:hypothetical protein
MRISVVFTIRSAGAILTTTSTNIGRRQRSLLSKLRGLPIFFEGVLKVDHALLANLDETSLGMIEVGDDRDDDREQDGQDHRRKRVPAGLTERGRITRSPADGDRHQHQQPNGSRHVVTQSGLPLCTHDQKRNPIGAQDVINNGVEHRGSDSESLDLQTRWTFRVFAISSQRP